MSKRKTGWSCVDYNQSITLYKTPKWTKDFNENSETLKILEKNIGSTLQDVGEGIRLTIDKWTLIKSIQPRKQSSKDDPQRVGYKHCQQYIK